MKTTFAIAFENAKKTAAEKAAKALKAAVENLNKAFEIGRDYGKDHGEIIAWVLAGKNAAIGKSDSFMFDLQLFGEYDKKKKIKERLHDALNAVPQTVLETTKELSPAELHTVMKPYLNSRERYAIVIANESGYCQQTYGVKRIASTYSGGGRDWVVKGLMHAEEVINFLCNLAANAIGHAEGITKISVSNSGVVNNMIIDGDDNNDPSDRGIVVGTVLAVTMGNVLSKKFVHLKNIIDGLINDDESVPANSKSVKASTLQDFTSEFVKWGHELNIETMSDFCAHNVVVHNVDDGSTHLLCGVTALFACYDNDAYEVVRPAFSLTPQEIADTIRQSLSFIKMKKGIGYGVTKLALYSNSYYYSTDRKILCHGKTIEITVGTIADLQQIRKEYHPDDLLQVSVYAHGVSAFCGHPTEKEMIENINKINTISGEICGAWKTQQIGPVGVFITGEVTIASNIDLYSFVTADGTRMFDPSSDRASGLFSKKEELDLSAWDHCEFLIRDPRVVGVWVKDWYLKSHPEFRNMLMHSAKQLGVKVFVTTKRHDAA